MQQPRKYLGLASAEGAPLAPPPPCAWPCCLLPCLMACPRPPLLALLCAGRLVAVGGMTGARLRLHAAEALDPREGRWQPLPPAASARSSAGVAALHGCVYVVGGNVGAEVHEVRWDGLGWDAGRVLQLCVSWGGRCVAWRGYKPHCSAAFPASAPQNYAGVEAYVPAAGRWRECSPISHGRSGLSASPF